MSVLSPPLWSEGSGTVGKLLPDAVITDRSAPTGGPVDGMLYLAHAARARTIDLPGMTVLTRTGSGPIGGDIPLPGGLYQASKGRGLAENTRPSRARTHGVRRTLDETELGDWVDRLCQIDGEEKLASYRVQAEQVADTVGAPPVGITSLSQMIGAALGTQQADTTSKALRARQARPPYDHDRLRRFRLLIDALHASAPQSRPARGPGDRRHEHLPFFEAYFSNFIEGTEFEVAEAAAIVYQGKNVPGRTDDSHDLLGTYRIVSDMAEMSTTASDPDGFLRLLRARHATILSGRPDKSPGMFKEVDNRAGATSFVPHGLVPGTLAAGWHRLAELDTAFERSVYMMFLVSEVHPFEDGNGRLARVMANAELVSGKQARIIIPTVYREDYLGALRRLSRQDDPSVLIKALRYAQDYTAQIDFSELDGAIEQLESTNAFNEPESDDRLILPRRAEQQITNLDAWTVTPAGPPRSEWHASRE
jgi:hypothetical protein